jgi:hypothetical protein
MQRGRQLLGYGSGRSKGHSNSNCDPTLDNGCGVPGIQTSITYDRWTEASEAQSSGSAFDAGDEF